MNARGKLIVTVVPGAQPTHRRPRSSRGPLGVALVSLTLALAVLAGCGGDDETAFTPVEGTESAYCDTFRAWQVHELEGEGDDQPNPTALEAYWNDYLEFNATMLEQSPPEVRDEWELSERLIRTTVTPVLEKYDFDAERIAREGTPAEKGITEPPPEARKAQDAIHTYEARVCGVEQPPAADVVFEADDSSEPYCMAADATQSEFDKIASAKFDPDLLRTFLTLRTVSRSSSTRRLTRLPTRSRPTWKPSEGGSPAGGATSSRSTTTTSAASGSTARPRIGP